MFSKLQHNSEKVERVGMDISSKIAVWDDFANNVELSDRYNFMLNYSERCIFFTLAKSDEKFTRKTVFFLSHFNRMLPALTLMLNDTEHGLNSNSNYGGHDVTYKWVVEREDDYITVKIWRGVDARCVRLTVTEFNLFARTVLAASNCIKALLQQDFHQRNGPPTIRRACYALQYSPMYSLEERNFFSEELVSTL